MYNVHTIASFCDCLPVPVPCRDLVHRQIALACVGQMSLGVFGFGCEDALQHLLNLAWPNFLENAPHCIQTFILAIEGLRLSLGPSILLNYTLAVRGSTSCALNCSMLLCICDAMFHVYRHVVYVYCYIITDWSTYYIIYCRVCSIRRGRCATCTGRSTTWCTSGGRTRSWRSTRVCPHRATCPRYRSRRLRPLSPSRALTNRASATIRATSSSTSYERYLVNCIHFRVLSVV